MQKVREGQGVHRDEKGRVDLITFDQIPAGTHTHLDRHQISSGWLQLSWLFVLACNYIPLPLFPPQVLTHLSPGS